MRKESFNPERIIQKQLKCHDNSRRYQFLMILMNYISFWADINYILAIRHEMFVSIIGRVINTLWQLTSLTLSRSKLSLPTGCRLLHLFLQFWHFWKIFEWNFPGTLKRIIYPSSTVFPRAILALIAQRTSMKAVDSVLSWHGNS